MRYDRNRRYLYQSYEQNRQPGEGLMGKNTIQLSKMRVKLLFQAPGARNPLSRRHWSEVGQVALEHWFAGSRNLKLRHCAGTVIVV